MKKIKYSWDQFTADAKELAKVCEQYKGLIKNIYGIPRGGLCLATVLSHQLDIPVITDINKITDKTLIVDDIADTGKTLKEFLKDKKVFGTCTLWYHKQSDYEPTTYRRIKKDETWIVFPWEKSNIRIIQNDK